MAGWQDYVDLTIEWGRRGRVASGDAAWNETTWDHPSDTWADSEPAFITLADCELGDIGITRGRGFVFESFPVGTAQVQLVLTDDVAGEPVPSDRWSWRSQMTIGDQIRITAQVIGSDASAPLFRGDIRSLNDRWSPFGVHLLDIACTDISGRLGRVNLLEQETQGVDETSGERMHRIADHARIPDHRRAFDIGTRRLQPTNLARNLAGEAEVTTASEGGDLFVDRAGTLVFRQRLWWTVDPTASQIQMTWANVDDLPDPPVPDVGGVACPVTVDTRVSLDLIANEVNLARTGGTVQTARDTASMSVYGFQTFARSDLMNNNDHDVAQLAAYRVAETGQRIHLVDGIEVNPMGDPAAWVPLIEQTDLGYLHRLVWDDGDAVTDTLVWVQGITHRITPDTWRTTLRVWDRYNYTPADGWDVDLWDTALWSDVALRTETEAV